jgi:hypothetical protein
MTRWRSGQERWATLGAPGHAPSRQVRLVQRRCRSIRRPRAEPVTCLRTRPPRAGCAVRRRVGLCAGAVRAAIQWGADDCARHRHALHARREGSRRSHCCTRPGRPGRSSSFVGAMKCAPSPVYDRVMASPLLLAPAVQGSGSWRRSRRFTRCRGKNRSTVIASSTRPRFPSPGGTVRATTRSPPGRRAPVALLRRARTGSRKQRYGPRDGSRTFVRKALRGVGEMGRRGARRLAGVLNVPSGTGRHGQGALGERWSVGSIGNFDFHVRDSTPQRRRGGDADRGLVRSAKRQSVPRPRYLMRGVSAPGSARRVGQRGRRRPWRRPHRGRERLAASPLGARAGVDARAARLDISSVRQAG